MPLYEYRCKKCDHTFDLVRRLATRDDAAPCPRCKSRRTGRIEVQRIAIMTGAQPDAGMGGGGAEDFLDGSDGGGMGGMGGIGGMGDWGDDD